MWSGGNCFHTSPKVTSQMCEKSCCQSIWQQGMWYWYPNWSLFKIGNTSRKSGKRPCTIQLQYFVKSVIILCRPNYVDSFSLNPTQTHLILLYAQQKWMGYHRLFCKWAVADLQRVCGSVQALRAGLWNGGTNGPSSVLELLWKICVCEQILFALCQDFWGTSKDTLCCWIFMTNVWWELHWDDPEQSFAGQLASEGINCCDLITATNKKKKSYICQI